MRFEMPAVSIIGGTGAFRRYHRGTQRHLWRAFLAKRRTLVRFLQPLEHLPADAHRRFLRLDVFHLEEPLGVAVAVVVAEFESTPGDHADAAPSAITSFKDLIDHFLGLGVAR